MKKFLLLLVVPCLGIMLSTKKANEEKEPHEYSSMITQVELEE